MSTLYYYGSLEYELAWDLQHVKKAKLRSIICMPAKLHALAPISPAVRVEIFEGSDLENDCYSKKFVGLIFVEARPFLLALV